MPVQGLHHRMQPTAWPRRAILLSVGVVAVAIALVAPTWIASWSPLLHVTCVDGDRVEIAHVQIPGLLLNSPYGGDARGNATYPSGYLPGGLVGMQISAANSGADWAGFESNITISTLTTQDVLGPGPNKPCSLPFAVVLHPIGNPSTGITILGPGNYSDQSEPNVLFPGQSNSIEFSNGFTDANAPSISTCGAPAREIPLVSSHLSLWVLFSSNGVNRTVEFTVPVVTDFSYWLPADFGTWQIDNLSAPGGPGGGWAFSYTSCTP